MLALLATLPPLPENGSQDWTPLLKLACERLEVLKAVLSASHIVEYAPTLAMAITLKTAALQIIVIFARDMRASAKSRTSAARQSRRLAAD